MPSEGTSSTSTAHQTVPHLTVTRISSSSPGGLRGHLMPSEGTSSTPTAHQTVPYLTLTPGSNRDSPGGSEGI